jgi:hypothetical protein
MIIGTIRRSFGGRQQFNQGKVTRFGKYYSVGLVIFGSIKT